MKCKQLVTMKYFAIIFIAIFIIHHSVDAAVTEAPDDDDDWEDTSSGPSASGEPQEADDDGRVYKNPRNSPSAVCPRDEEQATLLGQKCLRKCSSDEDCKSKKKKCLCDGACGMSCIKPDRECPVLDKPDLGDVTVSGRLFGDKAVYSCPHGYHVVGLQSRNCQADGAWAGQAPACKQNIYCLTPPHIEHARHSALPEQATFDLDATIQYHCHTGYVTNGFPRAKCLAIEGQASWYGPDITCEPRSCGPPGELPHGWVTAECHTFGCRAALHCGAGFELVGKAERFCQSDGTWAPNELPTCVLVTAVQCPTPDAPRHGRAIYTSCAYNSIVSYECKYGYRLVGDSTRRCGADKKWSGSQPTCKEINCGHPGRLYNGWLENIEAGTGLGASIIFRCHDGMRMEGNSSTVCQLDGSWRYPLPKCLAPCVVPHVTQGKVILVPSNITQETNDTTPSQVPTTQIIGSSTMVHHGDALIVECEKNYEFPSNTPAVTCNNGTWTQIPKCQPARCKRLPKPPKHGMVVAPKTDHGMRARFHCKDGFSLRGPEMLVCSFGNWTGEMPICQEVYCPFPGYIENGKVLLVGNMGLYDYRPYVKKVVNNKQIMYDCDKGYILSEGPPGATCIGGNWSPKELPNCTLGQHPRLRWSRRRRSADFNKRRYLRSNFLRKYYHDLRKKSLEISNHKELLKSYDLDEEYEYLLPLFDHVFINRDRDKWTSFQRNLRSYNSLRNILNAHLRRKRDNHSNNISQFNKLFRLVRRRSLDYSRPYNMNSRKYGGYNFFGVHPRGKRNIRTSFQDQRLPPDVDFNGHKLSKRHIDISPLTRSNEDHTLNNYFIDILPVNGDVYYVDHDIEKRSIDLLPLTSELISHKIDKRHIDILPFTKRNEDHTLKKRSIDILPLNRDEYIGHDIEKRSIDLFPLTSELISHKIDKRHIDILPFTKRNEDHTLKKRSIDILPLNRDEYIGHDIEKRSIDLFPLTSELISHKIDKRHIDILPFTKRNEDHTLKKRSIDILPLNRDEHIGHDIEKRSIDLFPLTSELISHKIDKRHIDILPFTKRNKDHTLKKRSIDILPLNRDEYIGHDIEKRSIDLFPLTSELISHKIDNRHIDILPFTKRNEDHTLKKRSIDILPLNRDEHIGHDIEKRSIDLFPLTSELISHKIDKRHIDILPFTKRNEDHTLKKRSIDILPLNRDEHIGHDIEKRSIDLFPLTSELISHKIDKRHIDILPFTKRNEDHTLKKRSIDILPLNRDEHIGHDIEKRSIDLFPLTSELISHKIDKRHIDILPFTKRNEDHTLKKRSIDILPLNRDEYIGHDIEKRSIDLFPLTSELISHKIDKRHIDILPFTKRNEDHTLKKRSIDILPLNRDEYIGHDIEKRSIDLFPLTSELISHKIDKRHIDILPFTKRNEDHTLKKRSIDILPFYEDEHGDRDIHKRSIDIMPLSNDFISHKIGNRHIDILPIAEQNHDHTPKKRSIDILPLNGDEHVGHDIEKRSIDISPLTSDSISHNIGKRHIDILPFAEQSGDHNIKKRSIDIFPFNANEHTEHDIEKRSIDILPLTREFISHKIGKRHIDILPFENIHYLRRKSHDDDPKYNNFDASVSSPFLDPLISYKPSLRNISSVKKSFLEPQFEHVNLKSVPCHISDSKIGNKCSQLSNKVVKTTNIEDIMPAQMDKNQEMTIAKRDINGMKNSFLARKYEEMKKQWEEEMMLKKNDKKEQNTKNGNFHINPPLKVDPKDSKKILKNRGKFKDLPRVSVEDMIKRLKRTSRKTERLNQTTASVPKSSKDNKNHQVAPPLDSSYTALTTVSSFHSDDSLTNNGEERGKGKGRVKGPCDPISSEPYVNVEVVKYGRDPNITYSSGTIVRVACGKGYGLNLGFNSTAKCVRGRWKPMKPTCEILPCHIPVTENGIFTLSATEGDQIDSDTPLNETMDIENGQVVQFACETGFNVQGASNLRCWHGDWAVTSMPECVPAPCELPVVSHGIYAAGYRPGLTTAHGSAVTLHCERGYAPPAVLQCALGEIRVRPPEPCQSIEGNISSIREGQDFRGGSDIVSEDFDELEYPTSSSSTECGPPARVQGTLIYRDGAPANTLSALQRYPHGTEVTFRCIAAIMGERSTWKIFCDKGSWVGKSVSCEEEDLIPAGLLNNATCTFRNNEKNVVSFFNDLEIKEEVVEFPANAVLVSRCVDIGKYAMIGPNQRKCIGGEWDGSKPSCFGLNQENDYAMEKPPTILFRHQLGPIMQSNDGKLIVYPGTILHMECLWMRKFGNPKWNISHEYRKYPEGWSSDPGRDSYLEYRLSIFHAVEDDSGIFTCITPARQSHQVEIVVKAVECPPLPMRRGLISTSQSTKMGSEVSFSCANGNSLIGAAKVTCLPSGNWSAPLPLCESVECGEVPIVSTGPPSSRPRVSIVSRGVGGRAAFSCLSGWGLKGPTEIVCSPSGEWTPAPPICVEVSCPPPASPANGYLLGKAPFRAGDVVQFNCNPAHMMQGQPIVACQDNARWSGETPKCIQACSYPGTTISGRMSSVKFYYKIGETISFTCEPGLVLRGAPMLRCLRNGKWSNAIPICSRESSSNETYISGNDSDQLLNDAPILSEYTTTEHSVAPHSSPSSHSQHSTDSDNSKSDAVMSFTGETFRLPFMVKPTQSLVTKKLEHGGKLRKSKIYYKLNQGLLAAFSTMPTMLEKTDKITKYIFSSPSSTTNSEASSYPIDTSPVSISETIETSTQMILKDNLSTIPRDDVTSASYKNDKEPTIIITLGNVQSTEQTPKKFVQMQPSVESTLLQSSEISSTAVNRSVSDDDSPKISIYRSHSYSTAEDYLLSTVNTPVKTKQRKIIKIPVVKNCTEMEDVEIDVENENNIHHTKVDMSKFGLESTKATLTGSIFATEASNMDKARTTDSSGSRIELLSTYAVTNLTDGSLYTHPIPPTTRKPKNKVSLDLLSLFQEIDKIENKHNRTLYGLGTSKKKDLSHVQDATNEEIEHIKKQLGIERNPKKKSKSR